MGRARLEPTTSFNFPDRCIRHFDHVLRIDPISTADATFSVRR
ncbi:hypothetical protein QF032_000255 [Streptomyces achromogenes]|uniref:Uncharacterized protein n=1 Tax=Streptomyces achromogenes TaxID=67255 RepID=A0ABU0PSB7_STRAH|nr:hypothetical protein [Streptomyces achromogenes]MDQ0828411.1 hypothetical protein [Streptomyces achromogenes]